MVAKGQRANFWYDSASRRWILSGRSGGEIFSIGDSGLTSINNMTVPTLATLRAVNVAGTGTIATFQSTAATAVNLTVGTLGTIRAVTVAGTGSIGIVDIGTSVKVAAGTAVTLINKFVGTLAAIAAVGTMATAVGTVTGFTGAVGDFVFGVPKAAIAGNIGVIGFRVPTTNCLNAYLVNPQVDSAGSLAAAVGFDLFQIR